MNFVFPQFLWALSALSIPLIIHLFNFRRTTRVYFSNTRFLRQVNEETTQKRKVKHLLVLLSRLLFILFLVLAFAQPFLPAEDQVNSGRNIVIYLDNSYSMSAQVADKMRALDAGTSFVSEIVEVFPTETRYRLLTNDFAPFSNSYKTKAEILDILAQIRLSPASRSVTEIQKRINNGPVHADVFWISDFQKSTFGVTDEAFDSLSRWHLVPVALERSANVFIDSVYLENPFGIGGEKNSVKARLRNAGPNRVEGLITKLIINDIQAATTAVDIEANGFAEASFDLTTGLSGINKGKVSFTDFPVSFDNDFYFTLNFSKAINVVEIKANDKPSFIERVYGNPALFNYKGFQINNIDYSYVNQADVVILNGIDRVGNALGASLSDYLNNFGTLVVIPGLQPDVNSYRFIRGMMPLSQDISGAKDLTELDRPDFKNPFFENVFEEQAALIAMPKAKRLLDWGQDRSAILKFKNGQPFLSQNGKVYLFTSPLDKTYTDFYNHALFVPVMYRIAAAGRRDEQRAYYTLNENLITLKADSLFGEEPVRLAGEQEIVPPQRRVGDKVFLEIPKFSMNPGFYSATFKGDTLDLLAFDLDKRESFLDHYSGEEVKSLLGGGDYLSVFEGSSTDVFSKEIKERYLGTPLWKHALILALFFLLAEIILLRFFK